MLNFIIILIRPNLKKNQFNVSGKFVHISEKIIRNVKSRIYTLPINLHKHQLYLLEQHSESFEFGQQL